MTTKNRWPIAIGALLTVAFGAPLAPSAAEARECGDLHASLSTDPLAGGAAVVSANKTFRVQERPWAHIPTGARITVRAPAGVTEADVHRAAVCAASESSPLSVPGAQLRVERAGDLYELHVTAPLRSAALEIQRRATAL
jgi:hypothetical protein